MTDILIAYGGSTVATVVTLVVMFLGAAWLWKEWYRGWSARPNNYITLSNVCSNTVDNIISSYLSDKVICLDVNGNSYISIYNIN